MHTILRLPAVMARTGLSRSNIYLKISHRTFPKQINLGARAVGWLDSEIESWLSLHVDQSRLYQNNTGKRDPSEWQTLQKMDASGKTGLKPGG